MTVQTYPKLTDATTDPELIWLWISQKPETTQKTYRTIARQFLEFTQKELREIFLEDIILWLRSFELRSYSQNTINNKLATIKSLFGFGVKTGYLSGNPAALAKATPAKDALNERLLLQGEVRRLISAARPGRDRTLLKLLYTLGLRVSEITGLNWTDFRETDTGVVVAIFGKGAKTRTLIIDHSLWLEIQKLPHENEAVFLSRFNNRLDRHAVHRLIKAAVTKAGINPHTSAHWLRHAHACHSLKNGAGVELLMKSLGHSSLAVTSRYLHVEPSECTSKFIQLD